MQVSTQDASLHVEIEGPIVGTRVLLVHGLGGCAATWEAARSILSRELRVLTPDLRGCGASERGRAPYSLDLMVRDMAAILEATSGGPVVAVGHSFGGVIVQAMMERRPELVRAAVLVSTSSHLSEKATANWQRVADVVAQRGISQNPSTHLRGFTERFVAEHPVTAGRHADLAMAAVPAVYAEQARTASHYDFRESLPAGTCPVLVVQGLEDALTPPGGAVLLARALGDRAELQMMADCGHNLIIEKAEEFSTLVRGFINRLPGPA
jgi:pimeloyl-ACP methyl ester carboxylesterase